jgi:glycosyltransferase involved in cell wall biosynthesis
MKVSILITSFNREKFIAEAIESVLCSSFQDYELIIVDDCSTDSTIEIARKYEAQDSRVKVYVNEKNLGDYPNRNKAASYAKGKYLKYLDSDDIMYPHCLQVMVNSMEMFPDAGFGLSSKVGIEEPFPSLIKPRQIYWENFYNFRHFDRAPGSAIIKTSVFKEIGGFSGKRMIGDYEFWFKISRKYSMVKFSFDLYWNRIHADQESSSEYAKQYRKLRHQVLMQNLFDEECPLSKDEVRVILKKEKIKRVIGLFKSVIFK